MEETVVLYCVILSYASIYVCGTLHCSDNGKTPLLCAAEAGHDEIVAYLLGFEEVQADLENESGKVYSASVSYSYTTYHL